MTPLEFFRIIAKQFADLTDDEVNGWLTIASLNANTGCLTGDRANLALALYAAHLASLDADNSTGEGGLGNVKTRREGDLTLSYVGGYLDGQWLGLSPYGQQYNDMLLGCFGAPIMTRYGANPPPVVAPYADDVTVFGPPRNLY